jgi:hypothetical protein
MKLLIPKFISTLFHPLLMPTYGILLLLNSGTYISFIEPRAKLAIFFVICTGTFILPISFIPAFLYRNVIVSAEMKSQNERAIPLSVTSVLYLFVLILLWNYHAPKLIVNFALAATISVILVTIITIKWKISAHLTGIGGLAGMILSMLLNTSAGLLTWFMLSILLAGFLGTARLILDAHTPKQIYSGFMMGFFTAFLIMTYL